MEGAALIKLELWSRSSGDDEPLVAGFARQSGGFDGLGSVNTGGARTAVVGRVAPRFPDAAADR